MPYLVTSGFGAGNRRLLAGEVSICPAVTSQFLFLPGTSVVPRVCLSASWEETNH